MWFLVVGGVWACGGDGCGVCDYVCGGVELGFCVGLVGCWWVG